MSNDVLRMPEGSDRVAPGQGVSRVIEILVKPGDTVAKDDSVITIENDKFTLEVPSNRSGTIAAVLVVLGQAVAEGTPILSYEPSSAAAAPRSNSEPRVFLVHGRNDGLKETVARCIEKIGLKVTILHELANEGRTVIEKFEESANAQFAVILMTADDHGGLRSDGNLTPRARQNVIFELGYFVGKIGRSKVCALFEPSVEMPSDYRGVTYIEIDDKGAWRFQLARELKHADLPVDLNGLL